MRRLFLCLCSLAFVALAVAAQAAAPQDVPATQHREVHFGVNGHPLNAGTYSTISLEQQISLLKKLKLRTYRVNVNPSYPEKFDRLSDLVTLAQRQDIRILPVIVLPPKNYSDENAAYNDAKRRCMNWLNNLTVAFTCGT